MNGFGGGGFGGMGGGMGGMGGGGGGAQYKPNSDPKAFDPSKPNESTKKIEESTKQFSQSAEKLQQSFMSSLDKLTPEDNTADLLKELNESAERYSSLGSSGQSSGEIVDGITKQITENAKTIEEQWKVAATPWTTPKSQPAVPEGTSTAQRIGGLQSSNRQSNPLAVAMGAEPAAQHSSSIPESVPSGSYGFFKGAKPYNAPQTPRK